MQIEVSSLPKDPEAMRKILIEILGALHDRDAIIESLRHQLSVMRRGRFGRRSEKFDPTQLKLFAEMIAACQEAAARRSPPPAPDAEPRGHGRSPLPDHLVKDRREIHPPVETLSCKGCGKPLTRIGEEHTDQLEYAPASFFLKRFVRVKYACRPCDGNVVIAPLPPQPIEKGVAGPGFLAQVLVSKYADHLPLHRQEGIYKRSDVHVTRQSLCDWVGKCADLLTPVYKVMKADVLKSKKLNTDDTPVRVQDELRPGSTREGRLWVYLGDKDHPQTVYDYTATHGAQAGPLAFLKLFEGYLQADAYKGYDGIYAPGKVVEVGCWAHARRYFFDAKETDRLRAETVLEYVRQMYEVERRARGREPAERLAMRQAQTLPILDAIQLWMDENELQVLPKSPIGEAITYARNQWEALKRYTTDGTLEIDNNTAERALRAVAVGRKNWLFFGSDNGGRWAAVMYTLIQTCKAHGIDPWAYLSDVLERLPTHPASRVAELTPVAWKRARDEADAKAAAPAA